MDFFGHQEAARRKTSLLVAYFVLAVVLIIAVVYAAAVLIFVQGQFEASGQPIEPAVLWNPGLFVLVTVGILTVIVAGSL